jgi:hypothetical protein
VGPLLHGLKSREELDLDLLNSLFGRAEADNEGFFIPDFGTIENIRGTVEFKALPKDVELKARANFLGRAEEGQAAQNLEFNISGAQIRTFIDSLTGSAQVHQRAEEDKNAKEGVINGLLGGGDDGGGLLDGILGPNGLVGGLLGGVGLKREDASAFDLELTSP